MLQVLQELQALHSEVRRLHRRNWPIPKAERLPKISVILRALFAAAQMSAERWPLWHRLLPRHLRNRQIVVLESIDRTDLAQAQKMQE
jgi:hypothetical protein